MARHFEAVAPDITAGWDSDEAEEDRYRAESHVCWCGDAPVIVEEQCEKCGGEG